MVQTSTKMSSWVARRLSALATDYEQAAGRPFRHFFCPVLYVDEDVELCEAHIVNRAFGASAECTVQRKDVDGFYGSNFESDFVVLGLRGRNPAEVIADPALSKRLNPRLVVNGQPVQHYVAEGPVPKHHTQIILGGPEGETHLALKMAPEDVAALTDAHWQIQTERDLRVPAFVSLLKAAHLTLFNMLGYQYALSSAGHFLGRTVLGDFYCANVGKTKKVIVTNAHAHFREFGHMVRPTQGIIGSFRGTADDHIVYMCERGSIRWGIIVLVRTSVDAVHAVLAPLFDDPVAAKIFTDFLRGSADEEITARLAWFRGDRWEASKETVKHLWPKTGIFFPGE
jgi:hypothetical protein